MSGAAFVLLAASLVASTRFGEPRPPIVFLHGMWSAPRQQCAAFERAAEQHGWLVCPRGNAKDESGGWWMWAGTWVNASRQVRAAMDASDARGRVIDRDAGGTLVGYSNGAWFAAEVASHEPGKWTSLVLLSMKLDLDAQRLREAGVRRVALAAGDRDDTRASLRALAQSLASKGLDARFFSLGDAAHPLPPDMDERAIEILQWARDAPIAAMESMH